MWPGKDFTFINQSLGRFYAPPGIRFLLYCVPPIPKTTQLGPVLLWSVTAGGTFDTSCWRCRWVLSIVVVYNLGCSEFSCHTSAFNSFESFILVMECCSLTSVSRDCCTKSALRTNRKNSIDNNCDSVENWPLMFACSIEFSNMADEIVWSPYLSRDQKWPHPPRRHKSYIGRKSVCIQARTARNDSKDVFWCHLYCSAVKAVNFYIFAHFLQKIAMQEWDKNLISNNSGSVEDSALTFAYNIW